MSERSAPMGVRVIGTTQPTDADAILGIVEASGQFDAEAMSHVRETPAEHLAGRCEDVWLTARNGEPVGVAYCAPEPVASGTWNLLMLWVRSDQHRMGHGAALVNRVEMALRSRQARLLIVETSSLPSFLSARNFYARQGFTQEATITNFFATGDDKLVFTKQLAMAAPAIDRIAATLD